MSLELEVPLNPSKQDQILSEGYRKNAENPDKGFGDENPNLDPLPSPDSKKEPEGPKITLDADSYAYGIAFSQTFFLMILQVPHIVKLSFVMVRTLLRAGINKIRSLSNNNTTKYLLCALACTALIFGPILVALILVGYVVMYAIWMTFALVPLFILATPFLFVPLLQISCLAFMGLPEFPDKIVSSNEVMFSIAKLLISVINILQVSNEALQGIRNLFYATDRFFVKTKNISGLMGYLIFFGCLFPGLMQLSLTLIIEYFSMTLIFTSEAPLSLITNFAGLYVILEFDVYVIKFLKTTNLILQILKFVEYLAELKKKHIIMFIFLPVENLKLIMEEIRDSDELEIKYEPSSKSGEGNEFIFKHQNLFYMLIVVILILNAFFPYLKAHVLMW